MNEPWIEKFLNGKDALVVTCGDSWTWGDSIPNETRTTNIYGYQLSTMLDSDFINVAKKGASNIEIHDNALKLIEEVNVNYKKIYVIFTLTEICREASWDTIWRPDQHGNLENFIKEYEQKMFVSFDTNFNKKYSNINFLFARNFTYSFEENLQFLPNHLEKTWIDILSEYQHKFDYPKDVRLLSAMAYTPLHKLLRNLNLYNNWKYQFFEFYAASELAVSWLEQSSLNYQRATKHPTELGHSLWALYLYSQIRPH